MGIRFRGMVFFAVMLAVTAAGDPVPKAADAQDPDAGFPVSGPRSIFRNDYAFFSPDGEVSWVSVAPTRRDCGVRLLFRLEDNFALRFNLLEQAKRSIRIQTYIFTADDIGKRVADTLVKKRKQGVEIKLIIDAYTKFQPRDQTLYMDLELRGVEVMGFEPVYLLGMVNQSVMNVDDINKRFHEKYWVIDEEAALVGGTNVANEYARYGEDLDKKWRDQDVLLTGPVVEDIARAFDLNHEYFKKRREGRLPTNQVDWYADLWWKLSGKKPPEPKPAGARIEIQTGEMTDEHATVRFIRSRPRYHEDYIYQAYLHLLRNARKSILIENAYFVPNRALINALVEAAGRGVAVTVITNCEKTNDVPGMQPLVRYSYLPLIEAGIKVYEWQGDHPGHGSLHAKFAVIDGQVSVIGSFNLDPRSIYLNSEDVVLIDSEKAAAELDHHLRYWDLPASEPVTPEQARKWHDPKNLADGFRLLFGIALEEWY